MACLRTNQRSSFDVLGSGGNQMHAQICTLHGIGSAKGPARKIAEFITSAIADTSDFDRPDTAPGPACFKCHKRDNHRLATAMPDDAVSRPGQGP